MKVERFVWSFNSGKTEIVNMNIENTEDCIIEGTTLKQVNKFEYLGTYLEFEERI